MCEHCDFKEAIYPGLSDTRGQFLEITPIAHDGLLLESVAKDLAEEYLSIAEARLLLLLCVHLRFDVIFLQRSSGKKPDFLSSTERAKQAYIMYVLRCDDVI